MRQWCETFSLKSSIYLAAVAVALIFLAVNAAVLVVILRTQSTQLSGSSLGTVERVIAEGKIGLEKNAIDLLNQKALDVAAQLRILKSKNPNPLRSREFAAMAVQKIGQTGYSCVYECPSGRMIAHPNRAIVGMDMHLWSQKLPSWWEVFSPSLKCAPSRGYYDWQDADGKIRKKYMVMQPIEGTGLMVAATAYLDEFTSSVTAFENVGRREIAVSKATFDRVTMNSFLAMALCTLLILGLMMLLGNSGARVILNELGKIREFAHEISVGNYDSRIVPPSRILEFRCIADSLREMRGQIVSMHKQRTADTYSVAAGRVAKQIAHDLRSPLGALRMGIQVCKADVHAGRPTSVELLHMFESVAKRLEEMVDLVLRPKAALIKGAENFKAGSLVEEVLKEFKHRFADSGRKIDFVYKEIDPDLSLVASRVNMYRVITNVLQNATEALPKGGLVEVEISREGENCLITVKDNGVGIPREFLSEIGKEGFTRGKRGGTGIGLNFCNEVVAKHGGDISISSESGGGTTVSLRLPAFSANENQRAKTQSELDQKQAMPRLNFLKQISRGAVS